MVIHILDFLYFQLKCSVIFNLKFVSESCLASTSFVYSGGSSLADSALRKSADGNDFYTQQGHW